MVFDLPCLMPDYVCQLDSYIRERLKLAVYFFRDVLKTNEPMMNKEN